MNLIEGKKRLLEIKKAINEGKFTRELYKELLRINEAVRSEIDFNDLDDNNRYVGEFGNSFYMLKQKIFNAGYLNKYTVDEISSIINNSFVLPLFISECNPSDVTLSGDNRYMFMCPFHNEEMPSLAVYDIYNYYRCFGCNNKGSAIRFIEEREGLNLRDAADVLCKIYLLKVKKQGNHHNNLVDKYQKVILSDRYKELLEMGRERLIKRKEQLEQEHAYSEFFNKVDIDTVYNERFNTIKRIENGIYIEPQKELKLK